MKLSKSLLLIALLALPLAALADHDSCKRAMSDSQFDAMDTDHDGTVSKEEFSAYRQNMHNAKHEKGSKQFSSADADNDGTLDREEAKKIPHISKNFDAIDTDKDGTVDRDEVHNFMHSHTSK